MRKDNDTATQPDMGFNVREDNNTDFSTTTQPAFQFTRFSTPLMTIRRDGKVGLGTTSPAAGILSIYQQGDGNAEGLGIWAPSRSTARMFVDSNNYFCITRTTYDPPAINIDISNPPNVGIGTSTITSPAKLHVNGLIYGENQVGRIGMGTTTNYGPLVIWKNITSIGADQRNAYSFFRTNLSSPNTAYAIIGNDFFTSISPDAAGAGSGYDRWYDPTCIRATSFLSSSNAAVLSSSAAV
jgi:hypothetical protein